MAVPPGAVVRRELNAIDTVIFTIRRQGLSLTLDYGSGGLPDAIGKLGWRERSFTVDGRPGKEVRYKLDGNRGEEVSATIEVHQTHDAGGYRHLPLGVRALCKTADDCRKYDALLRSIDFTISKDVG